MMLARGDNCDRGKFVEAAPYDQISTCRRSAGIPHATRSDICSGKTKLEKCSAETVYKLAKALGVSMELLAEDGIRQTEWEQAYEYGLPDYLQHDLDAYKKGLQTKCKLLDCLWGELYGSINMAEISDGVIT